MDALIVAKKDGREIRIDEHDFEFAVGKNENTFAVTYPYMDEQLPELGYRIYIPKTEYGGVVGEIRSSTVSGEVGICGLTWRGILAHKIICPDAGQNYYTVSGNAGTVIAGLITRLGLGVYFKAASSDVTLGSYSFDRYTDADTGIRKMLATAGCKMAIRYEQGPRRAVIYVEPVNDYSADVEMSTDGEMEISVSLVRNGVNHLIALGKGQLKDRTRIDIYTDENGTVVEDQVLFDDQEIMAVFEDSSAETVADLRKNALKRLASLRNQAIVDADVGHTSKDLILDDTISGRDYITGIQVTAPITAAICSRTDGQVSVEYSIEED